MSLRMLTIQLYQPIKDIFVVFFNLIAVFHSEKISNSQAVVTPL